MNLPKYFRVAVKILLAIITIRFFTLHYKQNQTRRKQKMNPPQKTTKMTQITIMNRVRILQRMKMKRVRILPITSNVVSILQPATPKKAFTTHIATHPYLYSTIVLPSQQHLHFKQLAYVILKCRQLSVYSTHCIFLRSQGIWKVKVKRVRILPVTSKVVSDLPFTKILLPSLQPPTYNISNCHLVS